MTRSNGVYASCLKICIRSADSFAILAKIPRVNAIATRSCKSPMASFYQRINKQFCCSRNFSVIIYLLRGRLQFPGFVKIGLAILKVSLVFVKVARLEFSNVWSNASTETVRRVNTPAIIWEFPCFATRFCILRSRRSVRNLKYDSKAPHIPTHVPVNSIKSYANAWRVLISSLKSGRAILFQNASLTVWIRSIAT